VAPVRVEGEEKGGGKWRWRGSGGGGALFGSWSARSNLGGGAAAEEIYPTDRDRSLENRFIY
jgi:hypothetical protein